MILVQQKTIINIDNSDYYWNSNRIFFRLIPENYVETISGELKIFSKCLTVPVPTLTSGTMDFFSTI
jgi:hypothetical protein